MLEVILDRFNYIPIIILMMMGLYIVVATGNLVKRLVGLSIFQTSVFLLYITIGKVFGGSPPIIESAHGGGHGDDHGGAGYGAAADHAGDGHGEAAGDHSGDHSGDHAADAAAEHAGDAGYGAAGAADNAADHAADAGTHAAAAMDAAIYSNPLPHVLILTAIVVGVATLAVGLALVVRIREAYGTIEDDALNAADYSLESGSGE